MEVFKLFTTFSLIDQISGPLRNIQGEIKKTAQESSRLSEKIVSAADSMKGLAVGAGAILGAVATTIPAAQSFEKAMAGVGAVSQASSNELAQLTKQARELGATTVFTASEAADAQRALAQAGFTVTENLAALPGVMAMAAAGGTSLARTTDVAANTLRGFGLEANQMGRVSDALITASIKTNTNLDMLGDTMKYVAPVAKAAGMSLEETAAMAGLLGNVGIQGGQAGTVLRAAVSRLAGPMKRGANAITELGVATEDAFGNMRSPAAILADMGVAMQGMGNASKAAAMKMIFGEEAMSGMLALTEGDSLAKLGELTKALENCGNTTQRLSDQMTDNLWGSTKSLGSAFESLQITIGSLFLPVVKAGTDILTRLIQLFDNLAKTKVGGVLITIAVGASAAVVAFVSFGIAVGKFQILLPSLIAQLSTVVTLLASISWPVYVVIAAVAALALAWKFNFGGMADKLDAVWTKIKLVCTGIVAVLRNVNDQGVSYIDAALGKDLQAAGLFGLVVTITKIIFRIKSFFSGLFSALETAFEVFWESCGGLFAALGKLFGPLISGIKMVVSLLGTVVGISADSSINSWNSFGQVLGTVFSVGSFVLGGLLNILTFTIEAVNSYLSWLSDRVWDIIILFTETIPNAFNKLWTTISGIFDHLKSVFEEINFFESGRKLLSTLADGIKSAAGVPVEAINGALGKVRQYLPFSDAKIGPLSTLTLSGQRLLETLGSGMEKAAPGLAETMNESLALASPVITDGQPAKSTVTNNRNTHSTNITIQHLELPGVQNANTFVEQLAQLVARLEGARA